MPLDPSVDKIRVRGKAQNSLGNAGLPPSFFPTAPRLVNKASHARIEMLGVGPYDNQADGTAAASSYWNPSTGDWWADLIDVKDSDLLAQGQTQWGQWGMDDRGVRYYIEPTKDAPTFWGNPTTGAQVTQATPGAVRTVWIDDLALLAPAASLPGVPTNSTGGLDVETVQDSIAAMFTNGVQTGITHTYRDDAGLVDTTVTVSGDLPEASIGVRGIPATTPTDLLGVVNEYTGTVAQPMPAATPGRSLAFRQRTVGLTLQRAGTDVFVLGDGSQVNSVSPSVPGELVQYHCTVSGQWRAVSDFKPTSALVAMFGAILNTHLFAWAYAQAFRLAATRVDTVGTTSGSPSITDAAITAVDQGRPVSGAGIPAGSYVGTVTAGASFLLSSSPTSQVSVNATATAASVSATLLGAARDGNSAIVVASIVWPDGSVGVFTTTTASSAFPGAVDAFTATYVTSSGTSKTLTQPAVTRDAAGAVVSQPAVSIA